jgi:hypothetical protein
MPGGSVGISSKMAAIDMNGNRRTSFSIIHLLVLKKLMEAMEGGEYRELRQNFKGCLPLWLRNRVNFIGEKESLDYFR